MPSPDSVPAAPPAAAFVSEQRSVRAPERTSALRRVPWRVSDIIIGVAVLLPWRLVASFERQWLISLPIWAYWAVHIVPPTAWMLLFPIWVARRRSSATLFAIPKAKIIFKEAGVAILSWLAIVICIVVVMTSAVLIFGKNAVPTNPWDRMGGSGHVGSSVAFLIVAMSVGPVAEELFFRGFLYNALRVHSPAAVALILQALIFGSMHSYGIAHSAVTFLLGIGLAVIYDWRKTLLTPIFVHCIQDTLAAVRAVIILIAAMNAPHLGVNGTAVERGCLIAVIDPGTTAEEMGLRKGDIIAKFDGQSVPDIVELSKLVRQKKLGDQFDLEVIRDGRTISMKSSFGHTPGH
jgi:membrane protease YdiL (CAAX protease family)